MPTVSLHAIAALVLAAGCGQMKPTGGPTQDLSVRPHDASTVTHDFSVGIVDFASPFDAATPDDFATAPVDASAAFDATPGVDLKVPRDATVPPDMSVPYDLAGVSPCKVVINEVQIAGATADGGVNPAAEAVELFNTTSSAICDLSNVRIVYRSAKNTNATSDATKDDSIVCRVPGGTTLAAGKLYYVCASSAFGGASDQVYSVTTGNLSGSAGSVGVRDASGTLVDSMGYVVGTANNTSLFIETAPAQIAQPDTESAQRHPDGTDTGNNSTDFIAATPTFGAANQ